MKVCVYGAGAIGGVIAARLALNGANPSIIARGAHLAAIKARGLRFDTSEGRKHLTMRATDDPAELGPQDLVICAVKAHQLPAIAGPLRHLLHADTSVVYAINGLPWWYFSKAAGKWGERQLERLDPDGALWNGVGVERTIGCVVNLPGTVSEPGVVHFEGGSQRLALGELDDKQSPRLLEVADLLRRSGLQIETQRPIRQEVWTKLVLIMVTSPIAILTGAPPSAAMNDPTVRHAVSTMMKEARAVAAAFGFPVEAQFGANPHKQMGGSHRPSILQDLEAGRPPEIDAQLNVPLDLAHEAGVAVPTLELVAGLARSRARAAGLYP